MKMRPRPIADLYVPRSNSFSSAGSNSFARLYHSVSLLLPMQRCGWPEATRRAGLTNITWKSTSRRISSFRRQPRGRRLGRPSRARRSNISWGGSFAVSTPDAANISQAVLMRPGLPMRLIWINAWWV